MKKTIEQQYTVKPDGQIELKVITIIDDNGQIYRSNWRTVIVPGDWNEAKKYNLDKKLEYDWTEEKIKAFEKRMKEAAKKNG